jgi:hypothetical protein
VEAGNHTKYKFTEQFRVQLQGSAFFSDVSFIQSVQDNSGKASPLTHDIYFQVTQRLSCII